MQKGPRTKDGVCLRHVLPLKNKCCSSSKVRAQTHSKARLDLERARNCDGPYRHNTVHGLPNQTKPEECMGGGNQVQELVQTPKVRIESFVPAPTHTLPTRRKCTQRGAAPAMHAQGGAHRACGRASFDCEVTFIMIGTLEKYFVLDVDNEGLFADGWLANVCCRHELIVLIINARGDCGPQQLRRAAL